MERSKLESLATNILDGAAASIVVINRDHQIVVFNRSACQTFGYQAEEVLGRPIDLLIPERLVEFHHKHIKNFSGEPDAARRLEHRPDLTARRKDGTEFPAQIGLSTIGEGAEMLFTAVVLDISARKLAEEKIRYQALLLESVTDIIVSTDLDGKIQSWNKAAERAFGYKAEEVIGKAANEVTRSEYARGSQEEVDTQMREKGSWTGEMKTFHRDGHSMDMLTSASTIFDEKGTPIGFLVMDHDITDRKKSEEIIQEQLHHLTALRRIDQAIAGSLDMHLVLDIALRQTVSELTVDAAAILLFNPVSMELNFEAGKGFLTNAYQTTSLRIGEGYAGRVALERRIIRIHDLQSRKTDILRSPMFTKEGFRSYVGIPLITKGEIKGVLEIFSREQLLPNDAWLEFAETLAGQIAIAIDSTTLFTNLQKSNIMLIHAYDTTIEGWSKALDLRDRETEGHTLRVTEMTLRLAKQLNIREEELIHIRRGTLLHDIGKMGVPDQILFKPGKLTDEEWVVMRKHPTFAFEMLAPISYLQKSLDIPYCHHEKWDGTGYPQGLKGGQIPLAARLFSVVDVFDALTSDRPYRPAWTQEKAMDYIKEGAGKDFDPQIVELFMRMMDDSARGLDQ